jgi:hypothetical protein
MQYASGTLSAWYWKGPSAACCMAASKPCISFNRRRASPTRTPAAAASLMARDRWAVPTPSLQQQGAWAGTLGGLIWRILKGQWQAQHIVQETHSFRKHTDCSQPEGREANLSARDSRVSAAVATRQRCTASRARAASGSSSSPHCSASAMQRSTAGRAGQQGQHAGAHVAASKHPCSEPRTHSCMSGQKHLPRHHW